MSEETVVAAAVPAVSPKAKKGARKSVGAAKAKKVRGDAPAHPKIAVMVNAAISTLKERGGSSLQAIKKYIAANYKVDVERMAPFIKKYLKSAVEKGGLVQTKGKGATGSFRLSAGNKGAETAEKKPKAKKAAKKPKVAKKPVAPKAKKAVEKKSKPKVAPKAKPAPAKSPKKAKAATRPKKAKTPTKPKSPKVKKARTPAKKAAAAKK